MLEIVQQIRRPHKMFYYFADESCIYSLSVPDSYVEFSVFDAKDLRLIETFPLAYQPQYLVPAIVDDNCVYLPSVDGRLIGQDKFSGKTLVDIDLGPMMAVSEPQQDARYVYTICGVPISDHSLRPNTKTFCICINEKDSGKKVAQTQAIYGQLSGLCVGEKLWIVANSVLYQFDKTCELEKTQKLNFNTPYKPLRFGEYLLLGSQSGLAEIFDLDLQSVYRFMTNTNQTPPVIADDSIYWCVKDALLEISNNNITSTIPITGTASSAICYKRYVVATRDNTLMCFNRHSKQPGSLDLGSRLDKPVIVGKHLFVASEREISQLCPIV